MNRHRVAVPSFSLSLAHCPKVSTRQNAGSLPYRLPTQVDFQNCMHGWPAYETLYGQANDSSLIANNVIANNVFANPGCLMLVGIRSKLPPAMEMVPYRWPRQRRGPVWFHLKIFGFAMV